MIRGVAFVVLGAVVSCAGFNVPSIAQRWPPNAGRGRTRTAKAAAQMSIREMIGADVESGGLFDPLGERERGRQRKRDRRRDNGRNDNVGRIVIAKMVLVSGNSNIGFMIQDDEGVEP